MRVEEYANVALSYADMRFGLYHEGRHLEAGQLHRQNKHRAQRRIYAPVEPSESAQRIESGLFMGYLSAHYGHFLLESLCRAWASRLEEYRDEPLLWVLLHPQWNSELRKWQRDILRFYGLLDRVRLVGASTAFDRLLIPEEGYRIKYHFESEHAAFLGKYPSPPVTPGKKVWITRSALKGRRVENEAEIEEALSGKGWQIVRPETLKWTEQLALISDCEHLAGFAGSGLHTVIALDGFQGMLHLFPLGPGFNNNFRTIADVKGLRQKMYPVRVTTHGESYQQEAFECGEPARIVELLSQNT